MVGHSGCITCRSFHVDYVSTKHIAYFLSSFFCFVFSFSLFICRCFRGLVPIAIGEITWRFYGDTDSWERPFYLFYRLNVIYISYCIMTIVCHLPLDSCIYILCLTLGVFTTSWWVVNQPNVDVTFIFASAVLNSISSLFTEWHFMVYAFIYVVYCFIYFMFCRAMSRA